MLFRIEMDLIRSLNTFLSWSLKDLIAIARLYYLFKIKCES